MQAWLAALPGSTALLFCPPALPGDFSLDLASAGVTLAPPWLRQSGAAGEAKVQRRLTAKVATSASPVASTCAMR